MSNWFSDWRRVSARLRAVDETLRFTANNLRDANAHYAEVLGLARSASEDAMRELSTFLAAHRESLPDRARDALNELSGLRGIIYGLKQYVLAGVRERRSLVRTYCG